MIRRGLGLGCATIGGLHGPVSADGAASVLEAAWEEGIRHFDVAPLYGAGEGERRLGAALRNWPREAFSVSTKVGWRVRDERCVIDYTAEGTQAALEDSLSRLGLDHVEAAFVHDLDFYNHGDALDARFAEAERGAFPALIRLREQGVIGAAGIAVNDPAMALRALHAAPLDAVLIAGRHTLLDHAALDALLPYCAARGIAVLAGAPFNTGLLVTGPRPGARFHHKPATPDHLARATAIQAICAAHAVPLPAAALQYPLLQKAVHAVLPGPRTAPQLREIAAWSRHPIPDALWHDLRAQRVVPEAPPNAA